MQTVKIEIEMPVAHLALLQEFLRTLGQEPTSAAPQAKPKTTTEEPKAKTTKKAAPAATSATTKKAAEAQAETAATTDREVTLNDLRALMTPDIVAAHKAELRKKLTELGAKNVSTIPAEHYGAFYSFLKAL